MFDTVDGVVIADSDMGSTEAKKAEAKKECGSARPGRR